MSSVSVVAAPAERRVRFEQSAGGSVVCLDFQSVAGLIDAVAGAEPRRLSSLLEMMWSSDWRMEMQTVLRAAIACRDPLSDLNAVCKDALRTLKDLDRLARARHWTGLHLIVGRPHPHASALLNACDDRIARDGPDKAKYKVIRPRLESAAKTERRARAREIELFASLRQARCPDLWALFEHWRDKEDA